MPDEIAIQNMMRSLVREGFWSLAILLLGVAIAFWPGLILVFSQSLHPFVSLVLTGILLLGTALLVGGTVWRCVHVARWNRVRQNILGETVSTRFPWDDPSLRFGKDLYAQFSVRGGCVFCGTAAVPNEDTSRWLPEQARTGAFVGGIVGAAVGAYKDAKEREARRIPLVAKGVRVRYAVCSHCKPSFGWTAWAFGIGMSIFVGVMVLAVLSGQGNTRPNDLQFVAWFLPVLVGGAFGAAGLQIKAFGGPVEITEVAPAITVRAPSRLVVEPES